MTTILLIVALIVTILLLLVLRQESMIYYPRGYTRAEENARGGAVELVYTIDQGDQVGFYVPPKETNKSLPEPLWLVFGGNASRALDWLDFVSRYPDTHAGFLLIDYPGYGKSAGTPSPERILRSSEAALDRLFTHLGMDGRDPRFSINVLGHSLGAAAGLQFAVRHPTARIVLIAPFTSLRDMARHAVGGFLARFLRHDFDNRARLGEIIRSAGPPLITIVHGEHDEVIPVSMGRELAGLFPEQVHYVEIPGGDHNSIIFVSESDIFAVMKRER